MYILSVVFLLYYTFITYMDPRRFFCKFNFLRNKIKANGCLTVIGIVEYKLE